MIRLLELKRKCKDLCLEAGNLDKEVKILAVSKFQSSENIRRLYDLGQREFGENYLQEALAKRNELEDLSITWHFIGRLQKNKIRQICGAFSMIHSVSSLNILTKINQISTEKKIIQSVLLQVNLANEASKDGFSESALIQNWNYISSLTQIKIMGLMTMPPLTDNLQESRIFFKSLRQLEVKLQKSTNLHHHPLCELSMGTSHDFESAILEGATYIRIGTALFGEREAVASKRPTRIKE